MDVSASDGPLPCVVAAAARLVAAARERFGVRRAALFWQTESGELLCVASAGPGGAGGWLGHRLAAGVGMAGRAVAEGRPVWSPDLLGDPRVPLAAWLRERLQDEALRAVAAAPLRVGGTVRGALGLLDGAGRTFGDDDLRRLAQLADDAGRELERATAPEG
jgi:GAF domain-containing protein